MQTPTEHRVTTNRRKARAGLVAIRVGPRVYWVQTILARKIEDMCMDAEKLGRAIASEPLEDRP